MPRYDVLLTSGAKRSLRGIDPPIAERILAVIVALGDDPRPPGYVQLRGAPLRYRVRMGDWRVIYEIDDGQLVVIVLEIGHRGDIYR